MTLEFPRVVIHFHRISKGKESFVLSIISKGKVTNLKDPGLFLKKHVLNPPLFGFFWNSPTIISYVIVIVQILTTSKSLNLRQKTTLFVLINAGQIIAGLMFAGLMFANFL